ncbi:MAG TPA: Brp/Blh family beta-carotene 15,15'-dioxygenase [Saprospiraceae bacterium]|nr:Brp/Blh family beta-carotene 15,15'-dioxygenase [Saprospiraceae bacterium]HMP13966.1 Brp/Blh family beta-carotene 15,15'-dioxygenase [Saprospiraceae bacterium]
MTERYPMLYKSIQIIALLATLAAFLWPQAIAAVSLGLAVLFILLGGIPHGATDHLIFLQLRDKVFGIRKLSRFYLFYILLMAAYGILWWYVPAVALLIFLGLSVYHFGQSNWNYLSFKNRSQELITYWSWGAWVLLMPVIWHYDASVEIIQNITGTLFTLNNSWQQGICIFLSVFNVGWLLYLYFIGTLNKRQLRHEAMNFAVLTLLFLCTPLLLGFVIYFVCWHSLTSSADQIRFFAQRIPGYSWRRYLLQVLPMTILAVVGLLLLYGAQLALNLQPTIGTLFIFISMVTLPHMLLIDNLYEAWKPLAIENSNHIFGGRKVEL